MKISKEKMKDVIFQYDQWKDDLDSEKEFFGYVMCLRNLGILQKVGNESFKNKYRKGAEQINKIERLVDKELGRNSFKYNIIPDYYDNAKYMSRLSEREKELLKANIQYLVDYCGLKL